MDIQYSKYVNLAFASAKEKALSYRHEFLMPEHLLRALTEQIPFNMPTSS